MNAIIFFLALSAGAHMQPRLRTPIKRPATKVARQKFPAVELAAVNLNETLRWRPFDDAGRARKAAAGELTRILRCWHTGRTHKVDPRLGRVLYQVARHFPG